MGFKLTFTLVKVHFNSYANNEEYVHRSMRICLELDQENACFGGPNCCITHQIDIRRVYSISI
jgi:hypothetical protein